MADAFPVSPAVNEIATVGMFQYKWNGTEWLFPVNEVPEGSGTSTPVATKRQFTTIYRKSDEVTSEYSDVAFYPPADVNIIKAEAWFENNSYAVGTNTTHTNIEMVTDTDDILIVSIPHGSYYFSQTHEIGDIPPLLVGSQITIHVVDPVADEYPGYGLSVRLTMEEI